MNWSRGLLRAWLLVSLLWVAGIGTLAFNTWPRDAWQYPQASEDKSNPFAKYVMTDAQMDADAAHQREVRAHLWHTAWLSLLPPAVLFGLGYALLWVGRGFRKA